MEEDGLLLKCYVHFAAYWGTEGAPILVSEIGFCMASCSYNYIYTVWRQIFEEHNFCGLAFPKFLRK